MQQIYHTFIPLGWAERTNQKVAPPPPGQSDWSHDVSTRIGPNSIGSYQKGDVTRHVTPGVIHGLDACRCEEPMKWVYKMKPPFVVT